MCGGGRGIRNLGPSRPRRSVSTRFPCEAVGRGCAESALSGGSISSTSLQRRVGCELRSGWSFALMRQRRHRRRPPRLLRSDAGSIVEGHEIAAAHGALVLELWQLSQDVFILPYVG